MTSPLSAWCLGLSSCGSSAVEHFCIDAADYPNSKNFILHYADMVDSTSLTNLLKYVRKGLLVVAIEGQERGSSKR